MSSEIKYVILATMVVAAFVVIYGAIDIFIQIRRLKDDNTGSSTEPIVIKHSDSVSCQQGDANSTVTHSTPDKTNTQ